MCRHLTSFIIQGENYIPSLFPTTPSPSVIPSNGIGGGETIVAGAALTVLEEDKVFKYPGRKKGPDGGFEGFVIVVFSNAARRQSSSLPVLSVTVDGKAPRCVVSSLEPITSVSALITKLYWQWHA
jgi:hypothetical protein